jgi:hypothetical protein
MDGRLVYLKLRSDADNRLVVERHVLSSKEFTRL